MTKIKKEYFGCSAEQRPIQCKFESNLCCLHCEHVDFCMDKVAAGISKIKPCTPEVVEETQSCEFLC